MSRAMKPSMSWCTNDVTQRVLKSSLRELGLPPDMRPSDLVAVPMPDPNAFINAEEFRDAYWAAEVWSKYPFDMGIDRKEVALANFFEYEKCCSDSNERLAELWSRPIPEGIRAILRSAKSLMEHLFEGFSLDEVIQNVGWGPGATTSLRRAHATPQNKWVLGSHITGAALPYFYAFSQWSGWIFQRPAVVLGNKVTTVPKNAKTERTIAIEPDWNMFFQLGVGRVIRNRLQRRYGLLKPDAQERNKELARKGSLDGSLATIDLKGASDTLSLALVEALVPPHVLSHLLALRSPYGAVKGKWVPYEKISSMGNGFTFELETAVFYCICRAASGYAVAYGDDLIVPSKSYEIVAEVLRFCGFEVNQKKSHHNSPFRESCGGHYFNGIDVTPPYVRRPLRGLARLSFCNRIKELARDYAVHWSPLAHSYTVCAKDIPRFLYGPRCVDGTLWKEWDEARPTFNRKVFAFTGTRAFEVFPQEPAPPIGAYIQALHGAPGYTQWQKSSTEGTRIRYKTWVSHWSDSRPPPTA